MRKKKIKSYPLESSPLYKLSSRSKLADLLETNQGNLRRIIKNSGYKENSISKKDGSRREIEVPCKDRKKLQKKISKLLMRIQQPGYLFCPVKGKSYIEAAKLHCGKRVIRSVDIKKFYPNADSKRVFHFFNSIMLCSRDIAGLLTSLCSYREHLPTGAPSSPIMALFAYKDMWEEISIICKKANFTLSIYVDDIILSADKISDKDVFEIKKVIRKYNLWYHKEKIARDRPREVLGLIIKCNKISLPNRTLKKLDEARKDFSDKGREILQNYRPIQKQLEHMNASLKKR